MKSKSACNPMIVARKIDDSMERSIMTGMIDANDVVDDLKLSSLTV